MSVSQITCQLQVVFMCLMWYMFSATIFCGRPHNVFGNMAPFCGIAVVVVCCSMQKRKTVSNNFRSFAAEKIQFLSTMTAHNSFKKLKNSVERQIRLQRLHILTHLIPILKCLQSRPLGSVKIGFVSFFLFTFRVMDLKNWGFVGK